MSIRTRAAVFIVSASFVAFAEHAYAQSEGALTATSIRQSVTDISADADQTPQLSRPRVQPRIKGSTIVMGSLYASTAIMQGLDVHSTLQGVSRGAHEMNPAVRGLLKHPAAFISAKALVGVSTIMAAREVAKKNKVAAAIALVALNSLYAVVVNNNYRVSRQLK